MRPSLTRVLGRAALVGVFAGASPSSSAAQPASAALKNLSLEELGAIEVTGTRKLPERVRDTAAAVYVITQEDIRRSGATTIPDVLRLAPGVLVNQPDANRWAVGIRGFADLFSKGVLVMIDGRSAYTSLVGGVHWAIQDVALADIERIEIIRGPGGNLWGANAVNGIINIVTATADRRQGVMLTAASGVPEYGRFVAGYGGTLAPATHYRVYGKAFARGPQFHPDEANFDDWRAVQGGFRTDSRPTAADTISVSGDVYRTRVGERAGVSSFSPPENQTIDGTLHLTGGNLNVQWQRALPDAQFRVQAYFDRTNRQGFTFHEVRNTWNADVAVRRRLTDRHSLSLGGGARISPSRVTQVVPSLNFVPNQQTDRLFHAYVQDDITISRDLLVLTVGSKVEHNQYTGAELLPSARVLWTPQRHQAVWGAITRAVRIPSRFERDLRFNVLADPGGPTFLAVHGSEEFDAETVVGSEVGYRHLLTSTLALDVVAFHNSYDGLAGFGGATVGLVTEPVPHLRLLVPFANAVEATTDGIEIAPDWKPLPVWQLRGSYAHLRLRADSKPGFDAAAQAVNYEGLAPRHQVRLQSRIDLPRGIQLDQSYRYVSALPAHGIEAYGTLDARLGWHLSPVLELAVAGTNLLQPRHREFGSEGVAIRRGAYVQLLFRR